MLFDATQIKKVGIELGWAGYPAIASQLCMFTGRVAAFAHYDDSYLIDGVAINGVSGGPVFCEGDTEGVPVIIGTISAYISNRSRGESLPGLLQAHDVTAFHETVKMVKSLDDFRRRMEKEEEQRRHAESVGEAAPSPSEPPKPEAPDEPATGAGKRFEAPVPS